MEIRKVDNPESKRDFLNLVRSLYRHDPEFVCPLDSDIEAVFDPSRNHSFEHGEACRWVLYEKGNCIGRIAAFYNDKHIKDSEKPGGIGFFECIENRDAAFVLFDTAFQWLREKSCTAVDAPINFGEKDKFWGLLVKGFENPSFQQTYNFPYYQSFFEQYGFEKTTEQTTSEIVQGTFNYERFSRLASRVLSNPKYHFDHYRANELERFASDFIEIYNKAWAHRPDFVPMTQSRIQTTLKSLKPILMEDIIWFAYADKQPIGFYVNVLEVNRLLKYLNGKMNLWGKFKFLWYRKFRPIDRVRGIVFGVVPEYQNLGIETGMIMKFYDAIQLHPQLSSIELGWIGDFNPKMHSLFDSLGARSSKLHFTYRKKV